MKTIKPKKLVLDNSMLEEEFFEDTIMVGIVSPLDSFRLIWHINQTFQLHFIRNHEYEIEMKDVYYEVYSFYQPDKLVEHFIYTNRKRTNFLLEEAKNVDFIWMIKGNHAVHEFSNVIPALLQKVKFVDHVFLINQALLKSKQLLIV